MNTSRFTFAQAISLSLQRHQTPLTLLSSATHLTFSDLLSPHHFCQSRNLDPNREFADDQVTVSNKDISSILKKFAEAFSDDGGLKAKEVENVIGVEIMTAQVCQEDEFHQLYDDYFAQTDDDESTVEEEQPCAVCLENMSTDLIALFCSHVFQSRCIGESVESSKNTCPLCRFHFEIEEDSLPLEMDIDQ